MSVFDYRGLDAGGKEVRGVINADNIRGARENLRGGGIYPTTIAEEKRKRHLKPSLLSFRKGGIRIRQTDLTSLYRQLSTLVGAGVPLTEAISGLLEQTDNIRIKKALSGLKEKVNEGSSFADAAQGYPNLFPELFVNMIAVGETSGTLDIILSRLADISEENLKLQTRVRGALVYPLLMSFIGAVIMFFLMTHVIPQVTQVFTDFKAALPLPTQILLMVSSVLRNYWYLILTGMVTVVVLLKRYVATEKGRRRFDALSITIPFFGKLFRLTAVSRFARTLSILLSSGVPMLKAMEIVARVVNNKIIAEAIEKAKEKIGEGSSVGLPLKESGLFPGTLIQMIMVGERSGDMEGMLSKAADSFEYQIDSAISALTSILEPVIIVVMAIMIGFIVISILLPIFEMSQLVK